MRSSHPAEFVGILGWPLEHTLSPPMHSAAFRRLSLDWAYLTWPVPPDLLGAAVEGLRALGARGANVTMPHKESIVPLLDEVSGDARSIGAVNTVQELGGRLIGHNTDVDGFRNFLEIDLGYSVRDRDVLILGAGGAARAVLRAVSDGGAGRVRIAGRDPERAAAVTDLDDRAEAVAWGDASERARSADLVVNATPLGMDGEDPLPRAQWRPGQTIVDLIYLPPVTPIVAAARAAGADGRGGLGMLVHQAVASFRIWTGQEPPIEVMSAAALHALGHFPEG